MAQPEIPEGAEITSHSTENIVVSKYTLKSYKHQGHTFNFDPGCKLILPPKVTLEALFDFKAFRDWLKTLQHNFHLQEDDKHPFHKNPYRLWELDVQCVTWFQEKQGTERIGFMKIQGKIETEKPNSDGKVDWVPGAVFLRGGSVGILIVLQEPYDGNGPEPEKYTILTIQPRIAAGSLVFAEIPAGMLDESGSPTGKAVDEIAEETGLKVRKEDLFDMSEVAAAGATASGEILKSSMYPSPGACDEFLPIILCQIRVSKGDMEKMDGALTGLMDEGERIKCKIVKLKDLWKEGSRDGKALAAVGLYERLKEEGRLPPFPTTVETVRLKSERSEEKSSK